MTSVNLACTASTWVNYSNANGNYNGAGVMRVGDGTNTQSYGFTYLKFSTAGITAGASIDSSNLAMTHYTKDWVGETSAVVYVARVTADWNPATITWNNRPSDTGQGINIGTRRSTDIQSYLYTFAGDLGYIVQGWLDGTYPNYGIVVYHTLISPATDRNASDYITIAGGYPPVLVTSFTPDGSPTATTGAATNVTSGGFTMNGSLDTDGGDALISGGFKYREWEASSWTSVDEGTTLGAISHTLIGLTEGKTYLWYTHAQNHVGTAGVEIRETTLTDLVSTAGLGGDGVLSSITGTEQEYGHGGNGGGKGTTIHLHRLNPNYGDGGDGGMGTENGSNGQPGVVILKYLTADAISVTPTLTTDVFTPSVAHFNGDLYAPYADPSGYTVLNIRSVAIHATTPTIETTTNHGLTTGQVVYIEGSDASASINGAHVITTVVDHPDQFTITPVNVVSSGAGNKGTVTFNTSVGMTRTIDDYPERGWLESSSTTFHTATILKDFRHVSVAHDVLPEGAEITMSWEIDGVAHNGTPILTSLTETRFKVNHKGYRWSHTIGITPGTLAGTPVIHGINLYWDFVKSRVHTYSLSVYKGAGDGRWEGDPAEAITFLFNTASERAEFEDRLFGEYSGTIEKVSHLQSKQSLAEGPSGSVELVVREVQ